MNLKEIEKQLSKEREKILLRIESINLDKERHGKGLPQDFKEQSLITRNDEVIDALDVIENKELNLINTALSHIKSGTYGICSQCKESISVKRLEALPYAVTCLQCSQDK